MSFLSPGEKVYLAFGSSRLSSPLLRYFFPGLLIFVLEFVFFFNIAEIPFKPGIGVSIQQSLTYVFLLIGLFLIVLGEIQRRMLGSYTITNYRVLVKRGILANRLDSLAYSMIVNVRTTKHFWGRFFNIGTIEITTARAQKEINLVGVRNPDRIESMIYSMLERHTGSMQSQRMFRSPYRR
ncbi:MAG: PH domain-containing protein [Candidatus Aenigmarchaeota archaeon]|nr:PH domain-containing protein [Candidatus Aenigmarchaeota archaeon]